MKKRFLLWLIFFAAVVSLSGYKPADNISLYIVHTNDIHGHIKPYQDGKGGLNNLFTLIHILKKEGHCDILIDSGDLIHKGNFIDKYSNGVATFKIFDKMGYDIFVPGNQELKEDFSTYMRFKRILKRPFLVFNVKNNGKLIGDLPYKIMEKKGIKVVFIGLSYDTEKDYLRNYKGWEDVEFLDVNMELSKIIGYLKDRTDIITLISHNGVEYDKKIAQQFPEIDIIFSGHDHQKLDEGIKVGDTIILETGCYLRNVGVLKLTVDKKTKKIAGYQANLIPVDDFKKDNRCITKLILRYDKKYNKSGNNIVGYLNDPLDTFKKSATFTAKAFLSVTDADCALINDGSERELLSEGEVTKEWIYMKSPYPNTVVTVSLNAEDYNELKESLSKYPYFFFYELKKLNSNKVTIVMDSYIARKLKLEAIDTKISVQDAQIKYLKK